MEPVTWFNKSRIKYFAFNLLEELDQPGEWYLNRQTGILFFYPPSDPTRATVEIGMLTSPMLSMANVSHVRVEGLVFDLSRSSGMLIRDSEHCLIAGCTLKRFAGNGIRMTGGQENGIFGCDLYSLGRAPPRSSAAIAECSHLENTSWRIAGCIRSAGSTTRTCRPCNSRAAVIAWRTT